MNVVSKALCIELFALSGWNDTYFWSYRKREGVFDKWDVQRKGMDSGSLVPRYSLGYLLRKLPARYWDEKAKRWDALHFTKWDRLQNGGVVYTAEYWTVYNPPFKVEAETPEDAACKLAIELFKQGILQPVSGTPDV